MTPASLSIAELTDLIARLHPDSLLLKEEASGLSDEQVRALWCKLAMTFDPAKRLATIEYLLLMMDQASGLDRHAYLIRVFLPWTGIQRRLKNQIHRIIDDIRRMDQLEADSIEDAAHNATKIYRPLVADVFDPYMTLLVATYQFIEGTFVDIETANLGLMEVNKAEFVEARIRRNGGPPNLLEGYNSAVRNALSHPGSDGVIYERGQILFRNIKRGPSPDVETVRWANDELHAHIVALLELVMSIDAACEIFGIDNIGAREDSEARRQFLLHSLSRDDRREIAGIAERRLEVIRTAEDLPLPERLDLLGKILFLECAEREIPCSSVGFNDRRKACIVAVPVGGDLDDDDRLRSRIAFLIRYAILARSIFGGLFDLFAVEGRTNKGGELTITLPGGALDDYIEEAAGLIDLVAEASVRLDGRIIRLEVDYAALQLIEDKELGPRMPRRDRPGD